MKIKSPIVTLLVGVLVALVVLILSVRAHHRVTGNYGAPAGHGAAAMTTAAVTR